MPVRKKRYEFVEHDQKVKPCTDLAIATEEQMVVYQAIKDGDENLLLSYIESGQNLNIRHQWLPEAWMPHDVDDRDEWNRNITPVHFAVLRTRKDLLAILLEHGANPNVHLQSQWKDTPLSIAYFRGNTDIIALLKEKEAQVYKFPRDMWWYFTFLIMIGSVIVLVVDVGTDVWVGVQYMLARDDEFKINMWPFGIICFSLILVANGISFFLLMKYAPVQHASASYKWKLVPIVPIYEILSFKTAIDFHVHGWSKRLSENMARHQRALDMLEGTLESLPQLILQTIIFFFLRRPASDKDSNHLNTKRGEFIEDQDLYIMVLSVSLSLLSIIKSTCVYIWIRCGEKVNCFGVESGLDRQTQSKAGHLQQERDRKTRKQQLSPLNAIFNQQGSRDLNKRLMEDYEYDEDQDSDEDSDSDSVESADIV